jgi:hypothetical protein
VSNEFRAIYNVQFLNASTYSVRGGYVPQHALWRKIPVCNKHRVVLTSKSITLSFLVSIKANMRGKILSFARAGNCEACIQNAHRTQHRSTARTALLTSRKIGSLTRPELRLKHTSIERENCEFSKLYAPEQYSMCTHASLPYLHRRTHSYRYAHVLYTYRYIVHMHVAHGFTHHTYTNGIYKHTYIHKHTRHFAATRTYLSVLNCVCRSASSCSLNL